MTDDLVKRLRTSKLRVMSDAYYLLHDAADRIEALEKSLQYFIKVEEDNPHAWKYKR